MQVSVTLKAYQSNIIVIGLKKKNVTVSMVSLLVKKKKKKKKIVTVLMVSFLNLSQTSVMRSQMNSLVLESIAGKSK